MAVDRHSISRTERYRSARTIAHRDLNGDLAEVASDICNPVVKLRFLRDVIDNGHRIPQSRLKALLKPIRRALLTIRSHASRLTYSTRAHLTWWSKALVVAGLLSTPVVLAGFTLRTQAMVQAAIPSKVTIVQVPSTKQAAREALPPVAETLPTDTLGITPTTIWLADHGASWELYSNGLRVETTYTVAGEPRRYRVHDKEHGVQPAIHTKPIGILFHTSESDIWPLDAGFDKQLRQSSTALLKYVQSERAYNYVVDRFGRVYRIVDDETRANHAGHAIWANGNEVYVDLNSAFLGVSFETRWEGGRALPITRAQLIAGRNLTNFLRQRFAIAPEMCVTHGLTSVSPKQHLIGYHMDWARGFPFAAFGLPDQYALPPPSIALFGFSYSDELLHAVGDGWPGLATADAVLAKEALEHGESIDALRTQRHAQYAKWASEARVNASGGASEPVAATQSEADELKPNTTIANNLVNDKRG